MKTKGITLISICLTILLTMSCQTKKPAPAPAPDPLAGKLKEYASFPLTSDLSRLSVKEKQLLPYLIEAASVMDDIFWLETYSNKDELFAKNTDPSVQQFLRINYGPWERLGDDKSFIAGIGTKPAGAQMKTAINDLAAKIITLRGDGNYDGIKSLLSEKGVIIPELQNDLNRINQKGIPKDIYFEQGLKVLGL